VLVELEVRAGGELDAAARTPPMPDDRGEAGNGANRHAAALVALQPVVHSNECGARPSVSAREIDDARLLDARNRCYP
jgi:hypothetical protein